MDPKTARSLLESARDEIGVSLFKRITREMNREKVNRQRDKRQKFPPGLYQKLFDKQNGICPPCKELLLIPAKRNEIDHINPNETHFNAEWNLQLLHPACNREKGSKSMYEQMKEKK